jgi:hypothetical protein
VLNRNLVPITFCRLIQNLDVKRGSLSDTIDSGTPCNQTISCKYIFVSFSSEYFIFIGIK